MPYTLNKTDGTILTDLLDNSIDNITTDITLVGKNTANYGELFNENFIKLLENFANSEPPRSPIKGQLWFDTSDNSLKIYDGNEFKEFSKPIVSSTEPTTELGDFWFNNQTRQLYFNDGNGLRLAGPIYTEQQGVSGFEIATIKDLNGINHIVAKLKLGNILVGIFSNDAFTPDYGVGEGLKLASEQISGPINIGFTPVSIAFEFNITAARSKSLVDNFGQPISVDEFIKVTGNNTIDGRLTISGSNTINLSDKLNKPLSLGWGPNLTFEMEQLTVGSSITPPVVLRLNRADQDFVIKSKNDAVFEDAIFIKSADSRVGILNNNPLATLDVNGDINTRGNIKTNNTSVNVFNETATTINFGGAATEIIIGAVTGTTTFNNPIVSTKTINANGGNLVSSNTSFNLLNSGTQTINMGDQATTINVGANNGLVTFKNDVKIDGDLNIDGIFKIDNVQIRNNQVLSVGENDLEIGALVENRSVFLIDKTTANEDLVIKKELTFDGLGKIRVASSFINTFSMLDEIVQNISFGGESINLNIGNPTANSASVNLRSKMQVYKDLIIGNTAGSPATLRSSGPIANILNTTTTINMAETADTINLFGSTLRAGTSMNIKATNVVIDGALNVQSGVLSSPIGTDVSLFNFASNIEIGNAATEVLFGQNANIVIKSMDIGTTGTLTLETGVVSGNIRGSIKASANMTQFEIMPNYVDLMFAGSDTPEIRLGQGTQTETYWTTTQGENYSPRADVPNGNDPVTGFPLYRTQFPVVISRHNHLVRGNLLLTDKTTYKPSALLFMNSFNEVVSVSNLTASNNGGLTVGSGLVVGGLITGPSGSQILVGGARFLLNIDLDGDLISTQNTIKNIYNTGVTTLNLGGEANSVINLGGTTSTTVVIGRHKVAWKRITGNYDAYAGDKLLVDTELNNLEIRLPPNVTNPTPPSLGDEISFIDAWKLNINVAVLIRNGNKINGVNSDLTLNTAGKAFKLVYTGIERGWCYEVNV
jgi:hypothetical protein